jgi:ABC-type Fe3+-hydroxamate transport system substrate-binding protein
MAKYTDQLGRLLTIDGIPKRIISLVPSQTELLFDLGLDNEVAGITKFCVHPESRVASKTKVGGTKSLWIDRIRQISPDLIIANKEENVREQVDELARDYPVWISDIKTIGDACDMIYSIGIITGRSDPATAIIKRINRNFLDLIPFKQPLRTCYLIWQNPFMTVGGDTFINHVMIKCGLKNIFEDQQRYPQITLQELSDKNCQLLLLSSEPFPFKEKDVVAMKEQIPFTKIVLVDGEMFGWYGSRLAHAPQYLKTLMQSLND